MYNLLEYNLSYSDTKGSFWFYSDNETANFNGYIANTDNCKSFSYKTKLLGNTEPNRVTGSLRNTTVAVLSKYLRDFWKSFEMPLINCKS